MEVLKIRRVCQLQPGDFFRLYECGPTYVVLNIDDTDLHYHCCMFRTGKNTIGKNSKQLIYVVINLEERQQAPSYPNSLVDVYSLKKQ